jgi:hypothetical protein
MTPSQNTLSIVSKQASSRRVDGIVPQPVSRQTSGTGVIAIRLATATLRLEEAIDAAYFGFKQRFWTLNLKDALNRAFYAEFESK